MDFSYLIFDNSSALIALAGVILGALLAAIASLLGQSLQRKWNIDAQRREWKLQRMEQQLDSLHSYWNQWLLTASRMRGVENTIQEANLSKRKLAKIDIRKVDASIERQGELLRDLSATSAPIILSINEDVVMKELYQEFVSLISGYTDLRKADDIDQAIESNKAVVSEAQVLISRMQRRADSLIDALFQKS